MKQNLFCAVTAFALSFVFLLILIPILRKMKAGQNILVYVEEHKSKGGTPTMGGLAFIFAAVISSALFIQELDRTLIITYVIGISYMIVGLLDDFLKKKHRENLGLRAWQKFLFQAAIAFFSGIYCYRSGLINWHVPFADRSWGIGWFVIPMSAFIFVAIVNAVNLTDGLDGWRQELACRFFYLLEC
jgi:phospho-N-acetylmuramoyl-pentapeptide-transferase